VADADDAKLRKNNDLASSSDLDDQILYDPLEETVAKEVQPVSPVPEQVNLHASFAVADSLPGQPEGSPGSEVEDGGDEEDEDDEEGEEEEDDGEEEEEGDEEEEDGEEEFYTTTHPSSSSSLDDVVVAGVEETLGIVVPDQMKIKFQESRNSEVSRKRSFFVCLKLTLRRPHSFKCQSQ
jgi:hypothetical protein